MNKQIHILVVEDDSIALLAVRYLLKELGSEFTVACSGQAAVSLVEKNDYDLIFMDIGLPDMDGFQITEIIRNQLEKNTPIIALTAHHDESRRDKCIQSGMNDFLEKPLTIEKTIAVVEKFIGAYK